jgi:methionine-rich copper-binding protein CopC
MLATAHTHLTKTVPADGSVLSASPPNFILTFAKPARLTALWLQKGSESKQKLGPLPSDMGLEISVPAPHLTTGNYILGWVSVAQDGHIMPGQLRFRVNTPGGSE